MTASPHISVEGVPIGLTELSSAARARVVSLRPAVNTTDQWVVTKAGERGNTSPGPVVAGVALGSDVLTTPEPNPTTPHRKRSRLLRRRNHSV